MLIARYWKDPLLLLLLLPFTTNDMQLPKKVKVHAPVRDILLRERISPRYNLMQELGSFLEQSFNDAFNSLCVFNSSMVL